MSKNRKSNYDKWCENNAHNDPIYAHQVSAYFEKQMSTTIDDQTDVVVRAVDRYNKHLSSLRHSRHQRRESWSPRPETVVCVVITALLMNLALYVMCGTTVPVLSAVMGPQLLLLGVSFIWYGLCDWFTCSDSAVDILQYPLAAAEYAYANHGHLLPLELLIRGELKQKGDTENECAISLIQQLQTLGARKSLGSLTG